MTFKDKFRYDGKRALVVGGATGMGAATAELVQALGGEVVVMDYAPVTLAGAQAEVLEASVRESRASARRLMIVFSFPVRILCPIGAHHAGALRFVRAKKATARRAFIPDLRANGEDRSVEQRSATSAVDHQEGSP
jgi:NAD(P)-dependent dehydrogenase (short-subunit alcohol dehydrogenase family)